MWEEIIRWPGAGWHFVTLIKLNDITFFCERESKQNVILRITNTLIFCIVHNEQETHILFELVLHRLR